MASCSHAEVFGGASGLPPTADINGGKMLLFLKADFRNATSTHGSVKRFVLRWLQITIKYIIVRIQPETASKALKRTVCSGRGRLDPWLA
jgi:hypothetical protein